MVLNRRKGGNPRPALAYGTVWHAILEAHYKSSGDRAAVVKAAVDHWHPSDDPSDHRTLERALRSYEKYLDVWGEHDVDMASHGRTIGLDAGTPVVELATELWWNGARHPYAGKIDRVFELHGLNYIEDHKTTSALGSQFFAQFDPSNQMMGYAVLGQELTGLPIAGVRINAHGVLKTMDKFERKIIPYSQERLKEWKRNHNFWIDRIENSMRMVVESKLSAEDLIAETDDTLLNAFPHQFEACAGKYGMCTYAEVCTNTPNLRNAILDFDFEENPWDPMAAADEGSE